MKLILRVALWWASDRVQITMNLFLGCFFLVLIPVALVTNLQHSVPFLVTISLWALVAAHWSAALAAWAARRVEESSGTA